jgi:energy-coupling factor transporter ATP-binding protein EcfA2
MSTTPASIGNPLRINKLLLTDFRGFPGPNPGEFSLDGKNLLVYGENGSGKSSVFYALSGFFSLKDARRLRDYKNVFSGEADANCRVSVEFNDGTAPVDWTLLVHPASIGPRGSDPRVVEAALRRACLDYRAILDTNYLHGGGKVNLFKVAVEHLLRDYAVTATGGTPTTIGALWEQVLRAKPSVQSTASMARINQACLEFNTAFRAAFPALLPIINELLGILGCGDIEIHDFLTPGLTYKKEFFIDRRKIEGQELNPVLTFRRTPLTTPQTFLNEARLSALGLSIYLAGRLACTPTAPGTALKLLVLDDVLIGLDHSNRLPVLDVLKKKFADWQIVLLTFDRVWFEMARSYLNDAEDWKSVEVFERADVSRGIPSPIVRPVRTSPTEAALAQASAFLADNHLPAAANYARAAFEESLKRFCEKRAIPLSYRIDPHEVNTGNLLSAIESWLSGQTNKVGFMAVIERVKLFRGMVLNPFSHTAPPTIARNEVSGAIAAVEALYRYAARQQNPGDPIAIARRITQMAGPSTDELHEALACLRAAFHEGLTQFCQRKALRVPFRARNVDLEALWAEALGDQARLFPAPNDGVPGLIEAERRWLISPVSAAVLAGVTQPELARVLALLVPAGTNRLILDTL